MLDTLGMVTSVPSTFCRPVRYTAILSLIASFGA